MASGRAPKPEVRAAGGVVWRRAQVTGPAAPGAGADPEVGPGVEVVLVHRPRHDDWSFPKGKLERGESFESAARREVAEETGLECSLGPELPPATYRDGKGRLKLVRYWLMAIEGTRPWAPDAEVDRRRWAPVPEAADVLTYAHDRELLAAAVAALGRGP